MQEGLQALDDIIAGAPDSFLAYAWRGVSKSLVGDLEGGLSDLTVANDATGGTSPDILRQRGNVLAALGRYGTPTDHQHVPRCDFLL